MVTDLLGYCSVGTPLRCIRLRFQVPQFGGKWLAWDWDICEWMKTHECIWIKVVLMSNERILMKTWTSEMRDEEEDLEDIRLRMITTTWPCTHKRLKTASAVAPLSMPKAWAQTRLITSSGSLVSEDYTSAVMICVDDGWDTAAQLISISVL
jgi:hypothetical protein